MGNAGLDRNISTTDVMLEGQFMRHLAIAIVFLVTVTAAAAEPVTIDTFVRAETDTAIRVIHDRVGFGNFLHIRAPSPLDDQPVITLSGAYS